jgi:haloalkane dehalogenase
MKVLRTPDERFESLPGFDFEPHYVEVGPLRVHYLAEGPPTAEETVLLMHGEPSWSYLYRKLIPVLTSAGHRVIAPDLVGFGRSDKPASREDYTYERHVEWIRDALLKQLNLNGVTLVGQDWGGLIGLVLVAEHPDRFKRVVAANTGLPTGDPPAGKAFQAWLEYSQSTPELPVGRIVSGGCASTLTDEVVAAYDAPFPDESYKEGARQFPLLVPSRPDHPAGSLARSAWRSLESFSRPFLCAFSDGDPITKGAERAFIERIPGAANRPHITVEGAGHFLQEDKGEELAGIICQFIEETR